MSFPPVLPQVNPAGLADDGSKSACRYAGMWVAVAASRTTTKTLCRNSGGNLALIAHVAQGAPGGGQGSIGASPSISPSPSTPCSSQPNRFCEPVGTQAGEPVHEDVVHGASW